MGAVLLPPLTDSSSGSRGRNPFISTEHNGSVWDSYHNHIGEKLHSCIVQQHSTVNFLLGTRSLTSANSALQSLLTSKWWAAGLETLRRIVGENSKAVCSVHSERMTVKHFQHPLSALYNRVSKNKKPSTSCSSLARAHKRWALFDIITDSIQAPQAKKQATPPNKQKNKKVLKSVAVKELNV